MGLIFYRKYSQRPPSLLKPPDLVFDNFVRFPSLKEIERKQGNFYGPSTWGLQIGTIVINL